MPQVQGWSVDGLCSPRSGVTNDMAFFGHIQVAAADQSAAVALERIEEGLITLLQGKLCPAKTVRP